MTVGPAVTPDGAVRGQPRLDGLYLQTRQRIVKLLAEAGDEACAATAVPACPGWTVHDVVGHLTGLVADVLAGRLAGMTTDAWTAAQVRSRREVATSSVLAEWSRTAASFAAMLADFPGWYGAQVVADITVHEHDIRGALGRAGRRESQEVDHGLDLLMTAVIHPAATALRLGPVEITAGTQSWKVGGTDGAANADAAAAITSVLSSGRRLPVSAQPPAASLVADAFDLFRAATGRRSPAQIAAFAWSGDPTPYLALFGQGPFALRELDLDE